MTVYAGDAWSEILMVVKGFAIEASDDLRVYGGDAWSEILIVVKGFSVGRVKGLRAGRVQGFRALVKFRA